MIRRPQTTGASVRNSPAIVGLEIGVRILVSVQIRHSEHPGVSR